MPTQTTRLQLQVPVGSDPPSELRTAITANANTLDNAALMTQGLLAARPAAGTFGRWYFATDDVSSGSSIGTAWFDTGSTWTSGWNPPSRGYVSIATQQEVAGNLGYVTMPTPDQVPNIVMPTNGIIRIRYQAQVQGNVSGGLGTWAALFLNNNQVQIQSYHGSGGAAGPDTQAAWVNSLSFNPLTTFHGGLVANDSATSFVADSTTGQTVGWMNYAGGTMCVKMGTANLPSAETITFGYYGQAGGSPAAPTVPSGSGGSCEVFAAAGTYTVSVRFFPGGGSIDVKNRSLWVEAVPFS